MPAVAQRNFAGGELAPSLHAHTDLEKYQTGLRKCRNMVVQRHGGVANRAGTEFVAEVKDSTKTVRLVRFHFNDDQTYLMEFGNLYIRWHKDGAPLTFGNPAAWSGAGVGYNTGDYVTFTDGKIYIANAPHFSTALNGPTSGAGFWDLRSNGNTMEITTTYLEADLMRLQMVQSADIVTIVHPSYPPRELLRSGELNWFIRDMVFGLSVTAPTAFTGITGGAVGPALYWGVSSVDTTTGEETPIFKSAATVDRVPSAGTPTVVTWSGGAGSFFNYVYRSTDGVTWGRIGATPNGTLSFSDTGTSPDYLSPPVDTEAVFNAAGKYPSEVMYYQQRLLLANTGNDPETVWASRTTHFKNFTASALLNDDDSLSFTMVGRHVNEIRHMLDLGRLVIFTGSEEKMVEGDEAGILRPDAINPRKLSANGSDWLAPVEINDSAIYLQSRGTIVRDLKPVSADSYQGTDLTVFAAHLFKGYTISDWDYAQNPHSILWAVRSDGKMLGLTYMTDQNIWGWHWHDTDGTFERVVSVPEGEEDSVYVVAKRTINGAVKRYIERLAVRHISDVDDMIFMDSALSYDGWNTTVKTLTISGGATWAFDETLTLTASASTFVAGDVGNIFIVVLEDANGIETDRIRFTVDAYSSSTVVTGRPDTTVPAGLRGAARATWARAIDTVTGLAHLEGKQVSVFADSYVVASPNNEDYPVLTVTGGVLQLAQPYAVINVGLPFISDVETLDLDTPGRATVKDRKQLVNKLGLYVENTRGIWAGQPDQPSDDDPLNGMQEYKIRDAENYDEPTALASDYKEISIEANWNRNGRVLVRQVDPLPLTILAVMPTGYIG